MSAAGSGAGEGVVLDADASSSNRDDGHRPVTQLEQSSSLSKGFQELSVAEEDLTPQAGPSMLRKTAHPAEFVSLDQPDARNVHTQQFRDNEDRNRQASAGTSDSYDTCNIGELHSNTSSSANALEDGDERMESLSHLSTENDAQLRDIQYAQPRGVDFATDKTANSTSPSRIPNGRNQESPMRDFISPLPTPASEEITALRMSGRSSLSADPYRGSSSSESEQDVSQRESHPTATRPSTSDSTRVPSNLSHDPLHNGERLVDVGNSTFQPIPLVELALHEKVKQNALQFCIPGEPVSKSRGNDASTQAQNGHDTSDSQGDPFIVSASSSRHPAEQVQPLQPPLAKADLRRERGDDFVETPSSSSHTSNRGGLFQTAKQSTTGTLESAAVPRLFVQETKGDRNTAAGTGDDTSSSSIGYRKMSADSNSPLAIASSTTSARPSQGHGSSSNSQTSQTVFAQQQAAPPFSQTVSPTSGTNSRRSPDQSKSSGSREKDKERTSTMANGKDRDRSRRQLGEWTLGKTLGAGSMGKVKLGVSTITGEKVSGF